jgi:hypothetical protein
MRKLTLNSRKNFFTIDKELTTFGKMGGNPAAIHVKDVLGTKK